MLKSDGQKIANETINKAVAQIRIAVDTIGSCPRQAMTDGVVRESIRMMRKLEDMAMEITHLSDCLDWEIDESQTIAMEKSEGEKTE